MVRKGDGKNICQRAREGSMESLNWKASSYGLHMAESHRNLQRLSMGPRGSPSLPPAASRPGGQARMAPYSGGCSVLARADAAGPGGRANGRAVRSTHWRGLGTRQGPHRPLAGPVTARARRRTSCHHSCSAAAMGSG